MEARLERTALLLGAGAIEKLTNARVALLGLGGVGGMAAEALCRAGVGALLLVDNDTVSPTNLNRQLIATTHTIGQQKTDAAARRLLEIVPTLSLTLENRFFLPQESDFLFDWKPDLVLDAIDTVTAKLFLAEQCQRRGIPLVSCLGTGNRRDPSQLRRGDISDTKGLSCPLARVLRRELCKRSVERLPVVYSLEVPAKVTVGAQNGRHPPGSLSCVPPAAGCILASMAIERLIED